MQCSAACPHGQRLVAATIQGCDVQIAAPSALCNSSRPVSMMWRRDSRAGLAHSENSSKNRMPPSAKAQAPGIGCPRRHDPNRPAMPPAGCGGRKGTDEWGGGGVGRSPRQALASEDFPVPGPPDIRTGRHFLAAMDSHFLALPSPSRWRQCPSSMCGLDFAPRLSGFCCREDALLQALHWSIRCRRFWAP